MLIDNKQYRLKISVMSESNMLRHIRRDGYGIVKDKDVRVNGKTGLLSKLFLNKIILKFSGY